MWSSTSIPSNFPASVNLCVTAMSSLLGVGFPDGWLWEMIIEEEPSMNAGLKILAGGPAKHPKSPPL